MDIKLIPKEYNSKLEGISKGFNLPVKSDNLKIKITPNFITGLFIYFFILSVLVYLGIFIYNSYLSKQEKLLISQMEDLEKNRDIETENNLRELEKGINRLSGLLANHIYSSKIFQALEELTMPQVQWLNLKAVFPEQKITLDGQAADYNVLAKQLTVLEEDPRIVQVETSRTAFGAANQIKFDLIIKFQPDFLRFNKNGN